MLNYQLELPDDQLKEARMGQRTTQHVKDTIDAAANLVGLTESPFVLNAAYKEALSILKGRQVTKLSLADSDVLMEAFDAPAKVAPALAVDAKLCEELIEDGA